MRPSTSRMTAAPHSMRPMYLVVPRCFPARDKASYRDLHAPIELADIRADLKDQHPDSVLGLSRTRTSRGAGKSAKIQEALILPRLAREIRTMRASADAPLFAGIR